MLTGIRGVLNDAVSIYLPHNNQMRARALRRSASYNPTVDAAGSGLNAELVRRLWQEAEALLPSVH